MKQDKKQRKTIDANEAFGKVERMLLDLTWHAVKRHPYPDPGEAFEELRSAAYDAFLKACGTYDPDRGASFTTFCYQKVWYRLKSEEMRMSREARRMPTDSIETAVDARKLHHTRALRETLEAPDAPYFSLSEFTQDLSGDAQQIIGLIMETPNEILTEMTRTPKQVLRAVRRFFFDHWGNQERVEQAVDEIKSAVAWKLLRI